MADDEDVIYVDVVPRLDEDAAEGVEESLKDKLKGAADGIGDGLKQATKDAFDQLKDAVDTKELGQAVGQSLGKAVGEQLSDMLPEELTDALGDVSSGRKGVGQALGTAAGQMLAPVLRDTLGDTLTDALGDVFNDVSSGKGWGQALGKGAGDLLGSVIRDQLGDEVNDHIQNITQGLQALGGFRGGRDIQGGIGGIQTLLGEIDSGIQDDGKAHSDSILGKLTSIAGETALGVGAGAAIPVLDGTGIPEVIGGVLGGVHGIQREFFGGGAPAGESQDQLVSGYNTDALYQGVFGGGGGGGGGGGTTSAEEVDVQSSVATVSAGSVTLGGSINLPAGLTSGGGGGGGGGGPHSASGLGTAGSSAGASSGGVTLGGGGGGSLDSLYGSGSGLGAAGFSQGGDVTGSGPTGVDSVLAMLAPGEGVLTPSQNDAWKSLMSKGIPHFAGGTGGSGDVAAPAPSDQATDAVGQPGEGGAADSGGAPGDQGGGAPGTVGGTQAPGAVQAPADQAQDAIGQPGQDVTDPAQQGIAGGTKTSKGIQDQSFGYGKGFQVTGQGLIGFAESAPGAIASAAAAGAGYDGSGAASGAIAAALTSAWNTIGEPEMNEAITQGVKIGADLASAPSQEFAVGGENFQNWSQKLIGGEIGNVTNLINTAANTQAPLTPQQGSGQPGQAGQIGGGQGTLGGQPSPQGTPSDPMHVNIVGNSAGQSGSNQSSNMTSVGMDSSGTA